MIVAAARSESEPEKARVALEELCRTYWMPLYTFVRSRGHSVPDAQDLTQSFFAHLIEREIYARADREKGRVRSFLLAALKNFLADAYSREHALKRGGAQEFPASQFHGPSLPISDGKIAMPAPSGQIE